MPSAGGRLMGDRLTSTSSYTAWGIFDEGHEYSKCLEVCTSKALARQRRDRYERQGSKEVGHLRFVVTPTTLLVHDGAHALTRAMREPRAAWKANCQANAAALAMVEEAFGQLLPGCITSGEHLPSPDPADRAAAIIAAMHEVRRRLAHD